MGTNEKLSQLLATEEFQTDILQFESLPREKQKAILAKYAITEKECIYSRRLLSNITFNKKEANPEEINYVLKKLMEKIALESETGRNDKARKIGFFTVVSRIAAILTVPLLLSTIYFYQKSQFVEVQSVAQVNKLNTYEAPAGAKTQVNLPDGSVVWLNSGSKLSFPSVFDPKSRNVELVGEAYFEVTKNEKVPMLVSVGSMKVKVYGTSFNVNSFAGEDIVETTLVEGKISLMTDSNSRKEYLLEPGFRATYSKTESKLLVDQVKDMGAITGWKDGMLLFHDEKFADILKKMERWYNVDIQLNDEALGKSVLYATFLDENVEQVFEILSLSIPISTEYPKRVKQADGSYSKRKIIVNRNYNKHEIFN